MVLRIEPAGGGTVRVTLDRPDVRNAFNADLIAELRDAFVRLGADPAVRAIVLAGAGRVFCGGADITWMRAALDVSPDENVRDAERMAAMFRAIDRCPKPVIGRIHGAALGGGAGLAAVCDIVVCSAGTTFGFTETKLGIIPAVISPFVLAKIGASAARALFVTGERFGAERAERIGLVHHVVPDAELDARVADVEVELATAAPGAIGAAKALLAEIAATEPERTPALTARAIAARRTTPEAPEG